VGAEVPPPPVPEEEEESDASGSETAAIKAEVDAGDARTASATAANTAANAARGADAERALRGAGRGRGRAAYVRDEDDEEQSEEDDEEEGWVPIKEESPARRWGHSPDKRSNSSPDRRFDEWPYRRFDVPPYSPGAIQGFRPGVSVPAVARWSATPQAEPVSDWEGSYSSRTRATEDESVRDPRDAWVGMPRAKVLPRDQKGRRLSFAAEIGKRAPKEAPTDGVKFYEWKPGMGQNFRDYKLDAMNVFAATVANESGEIKVEVTTTKEDEGTDFRWL
jgi:hypothetical protein